MKSSVIKPFILLLNLFLTAYAYAQTPVSVNGQLKVVGTKIYNQNGYPIQLRGMSTHGIQWYAGCLTDASLDTLTHDWGADILRLSMYVQEGGYETNPSYYTSLVKQFVDKATARGLYALIDFHILTPGDPNYNTSRAITFFTDIANTYKNNNNVLYEICNEPNGVSWASIKSYADQVIPVIRAIDNDAIICVGTKGWSSLGLSEGSSAQDIIDNPLNYPNIMYSFHFYAKSHQDYYLNHLDWASDRLPIFVTEFGTQEASGDGANDLVMGQRYMDLLRAKKISWTNWNYSDNPLSGGVWISGTCSGNTWTTSKLKEAGVFIRNNMRSPADDFGAAGNNLALGKTVTVSSTETSALVAAYAVDGNSSTRWASTLGVDPQWITVDLGNTYSISEIKINWEAAYGKNFLVQVSADNTNWTTLQNVQNNTSLSNDFTNLSGSGRYVRIYGTARGTTYGYSIYELEVYGTLVSSPNIALSKSVTVSSVEGAGLEGNYAVDGNTSTRWSATMYTDPQWITVDLGSNYNISRVKITWEAAYAKDYLLQVSTDNTNWTTVKTIQGNTSLSNDHSSLSATGRYVRMYGTARGSDYGYSIYELEVYGTASTSLSTLALTKTSNERPITVYPVPAHDQLLITIPNGNKSQISLCDINGKVYFSGSATGNTYNMNVSKLPAGIYIVQIINGNKKTIKKIVKE
ncbi:Por secretion system C-terminal sorting domain-containing protein [Chitinophaga sp. YR573]|uniref:cellulase family glycosylhydrolase n=1 Tax=Chitinophaga sp. YR573 TaxID=1881040 RepID=UPI0008B45AF7|nr:cellulase family glycosylhydrolase [Chitinophaga sp. YR573]SEW43957.1 Por secretion system C-terminal sorting domain-containing protein [Chitinophaga sp. YR573]